MNYGEIAIIRSLCLYPNRAGPSDNSQMWMFDFPINTYRQIKQKVETINYLIPENLATLMQRRQRKLNKYEYLKMLCICVVVSHVGWKSDFKLKFGQLKILTTVEIYLTEDTHKSIYRLKIN